LPLFDLCEGRLCLRIVYDGVACAGTTSNLRELSAALAARRTTELVSPAELDGRTLYFDWLQITAGVVCGFPLLCQVISVPGQIALTPRRRHLLAMADVVVYVCDSSRGALDRARQGLRVLDEVAAARREPIPLVLQANKQDQPDARIGRDVARALAREDAVVVEAIAAHGVGVVDTFVSAVRAGTRAVQANGDASKMRVPVRGVDRPAEVVARLERAKLDPSWAAELILEQASRSMVDGAPSSASSGASRRAATRDTSRPSATRAPLPTADVPTGFVWPAHTGRAALRELAATDAIRLEVAVVDDVPVHEIAGGYELVTSKARHFATADEAREALVREARERAQLGPLLVEGTVLCVKPAADGSSWLWTIAPRLASLDEAALAAPPERRAALTRQFAAAVVQAIAAEVRHAFALELVARSFRVQGDAVRYVGALRARATGRLLDRIAACAAAAPFDGSAVLDGLESAAAVELTPAELDALLATAACTTSSAVRERLARAREKASVAA